MQLQHSQKEKEEMVRLWTDKAKRLKESYEKKIQVQLSKAYQSQLQTEIVQTLTERLKDAKAKIKELQGEDFKS